MGQDEHALRSDRAFLNGSEPVQQSGYDPEIYAQERLKKM
jgi:hypothetical protein